MNKLLSMCIGVLTMVGVVWSQPQAPDTMWVNTCGTAYRDFGEWLEQTSDGGFIIAGYTKFPGLLYYDALLIKADSCGNELWFQTYGGNSTDMGYVVQPTNDGGYIIVGETSSYGADSKDVYLIKTDSSGNELWYRTFGGTDEDVGYDVKQTSDGGFIIVGKTHSFGFGQYDVYLIKTDENGNELWHRTFGGTLNDYGHGVEQTNDGGYIIVGDVQVSPTDYNVKLIKTDNNGNEIWNQIYGYDGDDYGRDIQQTSDGGYIIVGTTESFAGLWQIYLIKTDSNGIGNWERAIGRGLFEDAECVYQTQDSGYIIAGNCSHSIPYPSDILLLKTDANGLVQWYETYDKSEEDQGFCVRQTTDGGYILLGGFRSYYSAYEVCLIKTEPEIFIQSEGIFDQATELDKIFLLSISPNPFNANLNIEFELTEGSEIEISLYDITGKEIQRLLDEWKSPGIYEETFNGRDLANGVYFVKFDVNGICETEKIVLIK